MNILIWDVLLKKKKPYPFKLEKSIYQDKRVIYVANHTFNIIFVKSYAVILNGSMYTCKQIPLISMWDAHMWKHTCNKEKIQLQINIFSTYDSLLLASLKAWIECTL